MAVNSSNKKKNTTAKSKINQKAQPKPAPQPPACENRSVAPEKPPIFPSVDIAFKAFLSARCCSAIWNNIADCDETFNFWEPSHFLLYGKGLQTWEYNPNYALRSYTYLLLHVIPAWIYCNFLQPNRMLIFYFIRCFLGLFCALCETYFYKGVYKEFGNLVGGLLATFLIFSPGLYISSTAYLPSSFCMYMCLISVGAWMHGKLELAIFATALSTFISWPFSAVLGVPLALDILIIKKQYKKFIKWSVLSTIVILIPMIKIDSDLYGRFVVAPANILIYNIFKHGSKLYGSEPFSYYFINGILNFNLVFVFSLLAPFIIMARHFVLKHINRPNVYFHSWIFMCPVYIWLIIFTFQPHKEERFLFPVYPLICLTAAVGVTSIDMILIDLRFKYKSRILEYAIKSQTLSYVVFFLTVSLGVSRILALYKGYHAPMDIYMEFNKLHAEYRVPSNTVVNVCVGKEWHRFPNSFFLPSDNWNLKFVKSEFRGQLPGEFDRAENATAIVHAHFNDMNLEEPSRYFNIDNCQFLVDFDSGRYTELEPRYSRQRDKWKIFARVPFLNVEKSFAFFRSFYIPFLSDQFTTYSDYNLLISTKFHLRNPQ